MANAGPNRASIKRDPFKIDFYNNDQLKVSVNARGLMRFEHFRSKPNSINQVSRKIYLKLNSLIHIL